VGSGIFLTPAAIADRLPHPGFIFAVWILGALLSLAGALANAELGAMFPHAGGDYVYLREALHPVAGYLVGWITFFAIFAGTVATLAVGFAEGVGGLLHWPRAGTLAFAAGTIALLSWVNYRGVRYGAWANNATGWVKVIALFAFGALAPFVGEGDLGGLVRPGTGADHITLSACALAMSPVLFSYLGWNATVYVASEIRDPARNLPRSLFVGLAVCAAIYLLMNAVYLYALPIEELRHAPNAGEAAARALFGPVSGKLLSAFVLISILGTLNATVIVGPRVAYAMALDGRFLPGVERVHEVYATPSIAILLQAFVAIAVVGVLQTYPGALDFTTFAILLATSADCVALFVLRHRRPAQPRPIRALGYPVVPALYITANLGIAAYLLLGSTTPALLSLAVSAVGVPFYFVFARLRAGRAG
jgi:APA family basic amino acid/polyamine antiporter